MKIEKFGVYLANLDPQSGTEPGKVRPVVIIQTDLLNSVHSSTIVCPMTSRVVRGAELLRVHVPKNAGGLSHDSDVLVDQIRAVDNRRFLRRIGKLPQTVQEKILENLHILILE